MASAQVLMSPLDETFEVECELCMDWYGPNSMQSEDDALKELARHLQEEHQITADGSGAHTFSEDES